MTVSEEEKELLIKHRIEKAEKLINEVRSHIDNNLYNTAINRSYYGIFHIISALALRNDFSTTKHQQLLGWFNKEFVNKGIVDKEYGKIINLAYEMRSKSDYDDFADYSYEESELLYNEIKKIIDYIKKMIFE